MSKITSRSSTPQEIEYSKLCEVITSSFPFSARRGTNEKIKDLVYDGQPFILETTPLDMHGNFDLARRLGYVKIEPVSDQNGRYVFSVVKINVRPAGYMTS
jgi:hypothetical protein